MDKVKRIATETSTMTLAGKPTMMILCLMVTALTEGPRLSTLVPIEVRSQSRVPAMNSIDDMHEIPLVPL